MSTHGVTAQAFPGPSIFIWVPTERNPPNASIVIGFRPAAASPVALLLPYLSLKPPGSRGSPKTGLPAITSSMYRPSFSRTLLFNSAFFDFPSFFLSANLAMKSHPGTLNLSVWLRIFGAFRHRPSAITSITPPLTLVLKEPLSFTMFRTSL